jgi:hypothetical protein
LHSVGLPDAIGAGRTSGRDVRSVTQCAVHAARKSVESSRSAAKQRKVLGVPVTLDIEPVMGHGIHARLVEAALAQWALRV